MSDRSVYSCRTCGNALTYRTGGFSCVWGQVPAPINALAGTRPGIDCSGFRRLVPKGPMPRKVEVYRCSGCRVEIKRLPGQPRPDQDCACGGLVIWDRDQTR